LEAYHRGAQSALDEVDDDDAQIRHKIIKQQKTKCGGEKALEGMECIIVSFERDPILPTSGRCTYGICIERT
jgi:hypothetical protein